MSNIHLKIWKPVGVPKKICIQKSCYDRWCSAKAAVFHSPCFSEKRDFGLKKLTMPQIKKTKTHEESAFRATFYNAAEFDLKALQSFSS